MLLKQDFFSFSFNDIDLLVMSKN